MSFKGRFELVERVNVHPYSSAYPSSGRGGTMSVSIFELFYSQFYYMTIFDRMYTVLIQIYILNELGNAA